MKKLFIVFCLAISSVFVVNAKTDMVEMLSFVETESYFGEDNLQTTDLLLDRYETLTNMVIVVLERIHGVENDVEANEKYAELADEIHLVNTELKKCGENLNRNQKKRLDNITSKLSDAVQQLMENNKEQKRENGTSIAKTPEI